MDRNRLGGDHLANSQNVVKHSWDDLNRMKSVQGVADGSVTSYRASRAAGAACDGDRARVQHGRPGGIDGHLRPF
ncbi:MAG: hypothetical protein KF884_02420 [Fimbriimonadaceae bacterium]|nr:hypothetical protein [Fimbriimonadaceae bacterium]QYK58950.1 MAG: hypothetical protein KF884_02420 [Fimbriimonadaceae bacterium]